jgi:hypothetical protein
MASSSWAIASDCLSTSWRQRKEQRPAPLRFSPRQCCRHRRDAWPRAQEDRCWTDGHKVDIGHIGVAIEFDSHGARAFRFRMYCGVTSTSDASLSFASGWHPGARKPLVWIVSRIRDLPSLSSRIYLDGEHESEAPQPLSLRDRITTSRPGRRSAIRSDQMRMIALPIVIKASRAFSSIRDRSAT